MRRGDNVGSSTLKQPPYLSPRRMTGFNLTWFDGIITLFYFHISQKYKSLIIWHFAELEKVFVRQI